MQSERKLPVSDLAEKLSGLQASDVAPEWDAKAAWSQVDSRIKRRRRIPLGVVALAAAIAAMCLLVLKPSRNNAPAVTHTFSQPETTVYVPQAKEQSPSSTAAQSVIRHAHGPANAFATSSHKQSTNDEAAYKTKHPSPATPETLVLPVDTSHSVAINKAKPRPYHIAPQVVYTLNEIMTDVPEREAPPKKYSGLTHHNTPVDAPADFKSRRRPGQGFVDHPDLTPIIIN